jgi:hypothetical protein
VAVVNKERLVERLRYERKWLIEQLAGAWGWTEQEVSERLHQDTRSISTPSMKDEDDD